MARDPEFILNYLTQVETLANDVLSDKRDLVEVNKKRDKTREASRALKKSNENKTWVCSGNMFMCFTKQQASALLEKDLNQFDNEINELHANLKRKVSKLYDAENKPDPTKRFDLIPINKEEKKSLFDLIGKEENY